jgi:hypothetical protein
MKKMRMRMRIPLHQGKGNQLIKESLVLRKMKRMKRKRNGLKKKQRMMMTQRKEVEVARAGEAGRENAPSAVEVVGHGCRRGHRRRRRQCRVARRRSSGRALSGAPSAMCVF